MALPPTNNSTPSPPPSPVHKHMRLTETQLQGLNKLHCIGALPGPVRKAYLEQTGAPSFQTRDVCSARSLAGDAQEHNKSAALGTKVLSHTDSFKAPCSFGAMPSRSLSPSRTATPASSLALRTLPSSGVLTRSTKSLSPSAVFVAPDDTPPVVQAPEVNGPGAVVPDGGRRAWLQVLASFLLFVNCWGMINSFGEFQAYYGLFLLRNNSSSQIAWIGSCQAFLLLASTIITGPVFDKGHGLALTFFGSMACGLGLLLTGFANKYWHFLLFQGIVMGLSMGCMFIPAIAIIPMYFSQKRALAFGLAATGSGVGGVLYPLIMHSLLPKIGFGWTTRVMTLIMIVTTGIATLIIRIPAQDTSSPSSRRRLLDLTALKQYSFVAFTVTCFFAFATTYTPIFFGSDFAVARTGMSMNLALYTPSILNAASIVGRIVAGLCTDKFGVNITLVATLTITATLGFAWTAVHTSAGYIVFCLIYGMFSGAIVSLHPSTVSALTSDKRLLGTRMGMNSCIAGLGLLIGQPLAGIILNSGHGWLSLQLFCGIGVSIAAIFAGMTVLFTRAELNAQNAT